MAIRTNKVKLAKARTMGSSAISNHLAVETKVAGFLSDPSFNKVYDCFQVLAQICGGSLIRLPIPETLIVHQTKGAVFLRTDRDGIVRSRIVDRCGSFRLAEEFISFCSFERKKIRNLNPQGIRFPKFITFRENEAEFTVMKNSAARSYAAQPFQKMQKYVIPSEFTAKKLVVRWRRTKATKVYEITSRLSPKTKKGAAALTNLVANPTAPNLQDDLMRLDLQCIASMRNIKACNVRKETRLDEQGEKLLAAVNSFIATYLLEPKERLEETVFSMMKGLNGEWVFLNCARARTSLKDDAFSLGQMRFYRRSSLQRVEGLSDRISQDEEALDRALQKPLPNLVDVQTTSQDSYRPQVFKDPRSPVVEDIVSARVSDHLTSVTESWDRISMELKARKEESAHAKKLKHADFPPCFMKRCIDRANEALSHEPKFSRYFPEKERTLNHLSCGPTLFRVHLHAEDPGHSQGKRRHRQRFRLVHQDLL